MSCLAVRNFYSHNKILLSRVENNLLIDHSKFLKIFCDLYMYCSESYFYHVLLILVNKFNTLTDCINYLVIYIGGSI